ncbi:hypothetical protein TGCAST_387190 [Toxoplasma gondii CAST]|uniref:Secreted protein n=1 Tax=Toxoplasma gondii CAST TaxID=943122 RepID=A0A3R7YWT2_TOXGO|nr:hypothetical protein TGCAST_387190 [Toxoplasma gondii CAST]
MLPRSLSFTVLVFLSRSFPPQMLASSSFSMSPSPLPVLRSRSALSPLLLHVLSQRLSCGVSPCFSLDVVLHLRFADSFSRPASARALDPWFSSKRRVPDLRLVRVLSKSSIRASFGG